jgi:hypothetical protein
MGSYDQAAASREAMLMAGPPAPPDDRPKHVRIAEDGSHFNCTYGRDVGLPCRVDTDCCTDCGNTACRYCGMGPPDFDVEEVAPGGVWHYRCAHCERMWKQ